MKTNQNFQNFTIRWRRDAVEGKQRNQGIHRQNHDAQANRKNAKIQFLPKSADLDLMKGDGLLFTHTNTPMVPLSERNR